MDVYLRRAGEISTGTIPKSTTQQTSQDDDDENIHLTATFEVQSG